MGVGGGGLGGLGGGGIRALAQRNKPRRGEVEGWWADAPIVMEVVTRATFTLYTFSKYSRISAVVCLGLCRGGR